MIKASTLRKYDKPHLVAIVIALCDKDNTLMRSVEAYQFALSEISTELNTAITGDAGDKDENKFRREQIKYKKDLMKDMRGLQKDLEEMIDNLIPPLQENGKFADDVGEDDITNFLSKSDDGE